MHAGIVSNFRAFSPSRIQEEEAVKEKVKKEEEEEEEEEEGEEKTRHLTLMYGMFWDACERTEKKLCVCVSFCNSL